MIKDPSIKTILYITTQVTASWRYFSWCSFPSIWYCRVQNKVLTMFKRNKKITAFIKFHPSDVCLNPNINWIENDESNLKIAKGSLVDILRRNDFDLIVTEACATSLLQALCTKSQILAFIPQDFIKIYTESKDLLKRRVFLAESEEEYFKLLNNLMSLTDPADFKNLDDEFLFQFGIGTPCADPVALSRQAIQAIISQC